LIEAQNTGTLKNCELTAVISSNPDAFAITRAGNADIPVIIVDRKAHRDRASFDTAIAASIRETNAGLIVLAGFMFVLPASITSEYVNRIINVHPALIPSFCGKGYYGLRVHEAVLAAGVKVTGATVHFADAGCDTGPIILQRAVDVLPDDTAETLQQRVMREAEWILLPRAVSLFCEGRISVSGRTVIIKEDI